jgi:hypothetical protein
MTQNAEGPLENADHSLPVLDGERAVGGLPKRNERIAHGAA